MKPKYITSLLCTMILFLSCEKEQKLNFSEINLTTENNSIVEINIPKADGNSETASKINNTIINFVIYALQFDKKIASSIKESIQDFNTEFISFKTDFPDSEQQWEAQIDGELMYQSKTIISIAISSYINTGGAHGNLGISFLNFDTQTGNTIRDTDLFSNVDDFKTVAKSYFIKEVEGKEADFLMNDANFELPNNIGFNEEGIVLLYNTFEIAPYSSGILEFSIPFEEISSYLNY